MNNGVKYYNKEEQKKNKKEHMRTSALPLSSSGRTSSSETEEELPQGSLEPRERRSGIDSLPEETPPLQQDDVERAILQLFVNDDGKRKLRIRLNLHDKENAEFIAPLQAKSVITNFLKCTGDYKEEARNWFATLRKWVRNNYDTTPRQGKFHQRTGRRKNKIQIVEVEPLSYASVWYDREEKMYRASLRIYDFFLENIDLDDSNLTDKQKQSRVRGQHLYINPTHDKRKRPLTWAQRTGRSK